MTQQDNTEEAEEELSQMQLFQNQVDNEIVLSVHPNPFQNHISIRSPQKDQMVLKSVEGKVIGSYKIEKGQTRISTENGTNGIYILTFANQNKSFKLIKR